MTSGTVLGLTRRVVVAVGIFLGPACSGPPNGQVYLPAPPSPDQFGLVSGALEVHCGTLDCHGAPERNFRLYGFHGVRLDPGGVTGLGATTAEEQLANWQSTISIQPEVLSRIVAEGGARPERWILITKGRGTEKHKGHSQMQPGDATDVCLTSWLTPVLNVDACNSGSSISPPDGGGF